MELCRLIFQKIKTKGEKQMNIKKFSIGLLFLMLALLVVPGATAQYQYQAPGQTLYGSSFNCGTCHIDPNGGGTRTAYGLLFEAVSTHKTDPSGALTAISSPFATPTPSPTPTPVTPGNTAPVANDQAVTTPEGILVAVTLNATDADGNTLNYTVVSNPAHGNLSGTAPALNYTPDTGFNGSDSFTFKANDGTVDSNTATVSITVTSATVPVIPAPAHDDEHDGEHYLRNHHHRAHSNSEASD
jgi:hypothetical protein